MPKVPLLPENKSTSNDQYPKLSLSNGERARGVLIDPEPQMEYTHTLKAVQLSNGQVVTVIQKNKDGSTSEVPQYDFVGRPLCLGDLDVLSKKAVDPDNCPACEASTKSDAIKGPERRFALHFIRYKTQPGSFTVQEPFGVDLIAWAFGDKVFNLLTDLGEEWGDLKQRDLTLGPCESKQYQKFDIQVANKCEWLATEERKQLVIATFKQNKSEDLTPLIGRKIGRELMLEDIEKVMSRYRIGFGGAPADVPDASEAASEMDLDGLLSGGDSPATVSQAPEESVPSDLPAPVAVAPVQSEALDFDDILKGM